LPAEGDGPPAANGSGRAGRRRPRRRAKAAIHLSKSGLRPIANLPGKP
jgi:hypothetical protein